VSNTVIIEFSQCNELYWNWLDLPLLVSMLHTHRHVSYNTKKNAQTFHSRLVNLTKTKFTKDQMNMLTLGFKYAVEKDPKYYINDLTIDTENAIRHLDTKEKNATYRHQWG